LRLFRVQVVDPSFSYCSLSTYYAIDLYGAPLDPLTVLWIVLAVAGIIVLALVISYYYYRSHMLKKDA
jgi:hypothetical protein